MIVCLRGDLVVESPFAAPFSLLKVRTCPASCDEWHSGHLASHRSVSSNNPEMLPPGMLPIQNCYLYLIFAKVLHAYDSLHNLFGQLFA